MDDTIKLVGCFVAYEADSRVRGRVRRVLAPWVVEVEWPDGETIENAFDLIVIY